MQITKIYADGRGESHFATVELPDEERSMGGADRSLVVPTIPAMALDLRDVTQENEAFELHNPRQRQFVFLLRGSAEIETSDGERRTFGPGDVLFVEDVGGRGHRFQGRGPDRRTAIVPVPADYELPRSD